MIFLLPSVLFLVLAMLFLVPTVLLALQTVLFLLPPIILDILAKKTSKTAVIYPRPKGATAHLWCAAARGIVAEPPASRQSLLAGDGADSPTRANKKTTT
jgi:hypothetical protein